MSDKPCLKNNELNLFSELFSAQIVCATSNRHCGNMSLNYGRTKDALDSRKDFLGGLGIDHQHLTCAKQIHANNIQYVTVEDKAKGALSYDTAVADTDALFTDVRDLPLAVFTADCLAVFIFDALTPAVGIVHAGWRGTKDNIVGVTVKSMIKRFNAKTHSIYACFSPCIRSCCYQVGEEFEGYFPNEIIKKNNRFYLDLAGINKSLLMNAGVREMNIFDLSPCTFCSSEEFFSYRKEKAAAGRMMSVIMLKQ